MSDKKNTLPSLRKQPLDFLSREEAQQAVKPVAALDAASIAARRPITLAIIKSVLEAGPAGA